MLCYVLYTLYLCSWTSTKVKLFFWSGNQIFSSGKIAFEAHIEATYTQDKYKHRSEKWFHTGDNHPHICSSASGQSDGGWEGWPRKHDNSKVYLCGNSLLLVSLAVGGLIVGEAAGVATSWRIRKNLTGRSVPNIWALQGQRCNIWWHGETRSLSSTAKCWCLLAC